jgi:uncharacterized protein YjbI with pentapeptide repeats
MVVHRCLRSGSRDEPRDAGPDYDAAAVNTKPHRREPAPNVVPADLTPFAGPALEDGGDYEAVDFAGLDLAGASAVGSTFLGCRLERCAMDGIRLDRARFAECRIADLMAATVNAPESTWRDSLLADARIGALLASGSTWSLVRLRGVKANLVDLRGARLVDVVLEDCAIGELDLGDAEARSVRIDRSTIDDLSLEGARLHDVDLSGARLALVRGIAGLRGTVIGPGQLIDLAPLLAAHLGIGISD